MTYFKNRNLSRRPSQMFVTSTENIHVAPNSAPIAQVIKQRRASIYTVASDHNTNFPTEREVLHRRISRLSRESSGRSEFGGRKLTVPVISNVLDAEVSDVTTAEVVENSQNMNVLQTPTYQVIIFQTSIKIYIYI